MKFELNFETEEIVKLAELIGTVVKAEDTRCQRNENYKAYEKAADAANSQLREARDFLTRTVK